MQHSIMPSSIAELLKKTAAHEPERIAYTFLLDGEEKEARLTFAQLDQSAKIIATILQIHKVLPGARALLLYPPGFDFIKAFMGCLYAGVVPVPVYPAQSLEQLEKIGHIIEDAQVSLALTNDMLFKKLKGLKYLGRLTNMPLLKHLLRYASKANQNKLTYIKKARLAHLTLVNTGKLSTQSLKRYQEYTAGHDNIAFLQYTSGSTGAPKGVMVTHANLLYNLDAITQHTENQRILLWLPPYHDMGLVDGILLPLYVKVSMYLMSPLSFLQKPLRWLHAISHYKITLSGGPNFAYELCAHKATAADKALLDLRHWQWAFTGAEPIRAQTLKLFSNSFATCGFDPNAFFPCYGMAEATLMITTSQLQQGPIIKAIDETAFKKHEIIYCDSESPNAKLVVGCGKQALHQDVLIVNPQTFSHCADEEIGEIWVKGLNVAQGYWGKPLLTQEYFQAYLTNGNGPFLRTGDLAFASQGEIFITGRLKDIIIIHGQNYYPQDIEYTTTNCHQALRPGCCAAFAADINDHEQLVIVQELREDYKEPVAAIANSIRQTIAQEYGIVPYDIVLIQAKTISKTTSGKIRRTPCRELYLQKQLKTIYQSSLAIATADKNNLNSTTNVEATLLNNLNHSNKNERVTIIENYLVNKIHAILNLDKKIIIPTDAGLFEVGFDSISIQEFITAIEQDLKLAEPIDLTLLLEQKNIHSISKMLAEKATYYKNYSLETPKSIDQFVNKTGWIPLSYNQIMYWLGRDSSALNRIGISLTFNGPLDIKILEQAIEELINQQHILLVTISSLLPLQKISKNSRFALSSLNYTHLDEEEKTKALQSHFIKLINKPLRLAKAPKLKAVLIKISPGASILQLVTDHIVSDGFSFSIIYNQLQMLYNKLLAGNTTKSVNLDEDYFDYIAQERHTYAKELYSHLKFWQGYLQAPAIWGVPHHHLHTGATENLAKIRRFILSEDSIKNLNTFSNSLGMNFNDGFLTAIGLTLFLFNRQNEIIIHCIKGGYNRQPNHPLVGSFEKHHFVKLNLTTSATIRDVFLSAKQTMASLALDQTAPSLVKWIALYCSRNNIIIKPSRLAKLINSVLSVFNKSSTDDLFITTVMLNLLSQRLKSIPGIIKRKLAIFSHKTLPEKKTATLLLVTVSILPTFLEADYKKAWGEATASFDIDLEAINFNKKQESLCISLDRSANGQIELLVNNVLNSAAQQELAKIFQDILQHIAKNPDIEIASVAFNNE